MHYCLCSSIDGSSAREELRSYADKHSVKLLEFHVGTSQEPFLTLKQDAVSAVIRNAMGK